MTVGLLDPSRFYASILDHASSCESPWAFRKAILDDLRRLTSSDGGIYRPGGRWAGSTTLHLDRGPRFTDAYLAQSWRYRGELESWCARSHGREAFIDGELYGPNAQSRMAIYSDVLNPHGVRSILACPLWSGDEQTGLAFLFRDGLGPRFSSEHARWLTRIAEAIGDADHLVARAFAQGRPSPSLPSSLVVGPRDAFESLGPRERQVAILLARGLQSKEIAALLGSSYNTVRAQTQRIYQRLGLRGRAQIALFLDALGLAPRGGASELGVEVGGVFLSLLGHTLARRFDDPAIEGEPGARAVAGAAVTSGDDGEDLARARLRARSLGARERQVAQLAARGLTSREIAAVLGTSFNTVRAQVQRVYEKLGVRGRARLASALARGLEDEPLATS